MRLLLKPFSINLVILISLVFSCNAYSNFLKGNGTIKDPYQIANCTDLQNMSQNLSANYALVDDIDCTATKNWNNGAGFEPIGKSESTALFFTGTLEGNNHIIYNLYINRPNDSMIGLFGDTTRQNGDLQFADIGLVNVNITGGLDAAGGLAGQTGKGLVSNCYVTGSVKGARGFVGGLIGDVSAGVLNSYFKGTVQGNYYVGGLVGYTNICTISNSYASGSVTASTIAGGLVGINNGTISDSYAAETVNGGTIYVGGLVGDNCNGTVSNSYASGDVTGNLDVGGLVGSNDGNRSQIANSYSIGRVTGTTDVGGLLGGNNQGVVSNSYYNLDTSGQHDTGKGIPVADAQMKQQATFNGWDFESTWAINENNYYPVLIWDAGKENLLDAQNQLKTFEKEHSDYYQKYGSFQGITYNVSEGNTVTVLQTPNIWGQPLSLVGYIPWDGQNSDFSDMPLCTDNPNVCIATNTECVHLAAFYNGISGADIKRCVGSADKMVDQIYQVMTSAKTSIDITTLELFPDGRFLATMRNAITWLAVNNKNVTIRVLGGVPLFTYDKDTPDDVLRRQAMVGDDQLLHQLARDIPADKVNNINIYVGSMRSCAGVLLSSCLPSSLPWFNQKSTTAYRASWNHSKIIDADGELSIVGGQNWWTNSYLVADAIDDVNVKIQGPASLDASHFADQLWNYICLGGNGASKTIATSASWINGQYGSVCLSTIPLPKHLVTPKKTDSGATVMAIGRLGAGMFENKLFFGSDEPANQSEVVRNLLFKGAVSVIRIAQQNLQGLVVIPNVDYDLTPAQFERDNDAGNVYDILANFALQNGDVYIVETNYGAVDGAEEKYYTQSKLTDLANTFFDRARTLQPNLADATIRTLLCEHLHIAGIRYSNDALWPNQHEIGNHSKTWIVDDKAYYVGSHNIYPANLQEYGYIVGGQPATQSFIQQFWTPLWQYSQKNAISGSEISPLACYYNQPNTNTTLSCSGRSVIGTSPMNISYSGCVGIGSSPFAFIISAAGATPDVDTLVCTKYVSGQNNTDSWISCGKGEVGQNNYQVNY
jgi:hypothetical protein